MKSEEEYVLKTVKERGVRFIQLWFTDVLGTPKGFSITPAELENALSDGMIFDGSSIDGFSRIQESDMLLMPDANTFQILPWMIENASVARVVCDVKNNDGSPFEGCPRRVLKRTLDSTKKRGYEFYVAPEIEFFYFKDDLNKPVCLDNGSYFDLTVSDLATELRKRTVVALEDMGIPVEHAQHEDAPSQHEIDLRYTDAVTMADTIMTARLIIKSLALQQGVIASFMPKPLESEQGSGMHSHFSLFKGDVNCFADENQEYGLSTLAKHFIAGVLNYSKEITAVTNQWVNSYKRLVPGYEAPVNISWARNNRSALVRIPVAKLGNSEATRFEYRAIDSACNPYLVFALILSAGLKGIDLQMELMPETSVNLYSQNNETNVYETADPLPNNLKSAIENMENSEFAHEVLGDHVFEWFLKNKKQEWERYARHVTDYEIGRYLPYL